MKNILIALDYDPTAQKVAETGFAFAESMHAEITLMHVIADTTYYSILEYSQVVGFMGFNDFEATHLLDNGLKKAMKHYLDKTKLHLGNTLIQNLVKEGEFAETIVKTALEIKSDCIVMGSHSRNWLENLTMGSTTKKVLQLTTIPLFIIPIKK